MSTLNDIGIKYGTDKATHHKFMDFYESNIGFLRDEKINILEIGYFRGQSIFCWLEYFKNANIYCIDIIDVNTKHDRFFYNKISQADNNLNQIFPNDFFSIIIDDGSHFTSHQMASLKILWPKLKNQGFYLLEDLHTSFRSHYIDTKITTFDFLKNKSSIKEIDYIHDESEYIKIFNRVPDLFTDSVTSVIKKK